MSFVGNHYYYKNGDPNSTDNTIEDHECIFMLENDTGEVGSFPKNFVWGPAAYPEFYNDSDVETNFQFVKLIGNWDSDARGVEAKLFNEKVALERPMSNVLNSSKMTFTYGDIFDRYIIEGLDFKYQFGQGGFKPSTTYDDVPTLVMPINVGKRSLLPKVLSTPLMNVLKKTLLT